VIAYNPRDWFSFVFKLHKSDTIRRLFPLIILIGIYSGFIAFLELSFMQPDWRERLKNITTVHSLLGFVISLALVFRTNSAYDRWWEGRKLWGSLVNSSRNLAMKLNAILPANDEVNRKFFHRFIPVYAAVLNAHLRSEVTRLALDQREHPELAGLNKEKHLPNHVARLIIERVYRLYKDGVIKGDELITLNEQVQSLTDICGACERIKNTPIPFSYSLFIKKFIFFYVMTLPIGFVFSMGYFVIPVVAFVFYVLTSLELIAEEVEDPFGSDTNDLPLDKICENIKMHVAEII